MLHPATFRSREAAEAWGGKLDPRLWEVVEVVPAQVAGRFQLRLRPAKNAPAAE